MKAGKLQAGMRATARTLPALGIDLGGTKIEALLLGAQGQELWRLRVDTPQSSYSGMLQAIAALVVTARQHCQQACLQAPTVGVGTPGSLTASGVIKNANATCLNGRALQEDLQAALGQNIRMANDANCLALSEATDGAAAGVDVVFAVILGTGTGAGIAVQGRVLTGPNRLAGEWGHNPLPWADADRPGFVVAPLCYCGKRGCIETLCSGPGITREHQRLFGEALTAKEIAQRADAGDAHCAVTLAQHSNRLARALAMVINILDPDVIVLGGGLSRMNHLYTDLPKLWGQWVFSGGASDPVRTRLVQSLHGDASGVRGAAWLGRDPHDARLQ